VIDSVTSATPGFHVVSTNAPLVVTSSSDKLWWIVQLPISFSGTLTLNFTGTSSGLNSSNPPGCTAPCVTTQIPSALYQYSFGAVLPAGWIAIEVVSIGTIFALVVWSRRPFESDP